MCKILRPTKCELVGFILGVLSFMMFISGIFVGIFMTDGLRIMGVIFVIVGLVLTLIFFFTSSYKTDPYIGDEDEDYIYCCKRRNTLKNVEKGNVENKV